MFKGGASVVQNGFQHNKNKEEFIMRKICPLTKNSYNNKVNDKTCERFVLNALLTNNICKNRTIYDTSPIND